MHEMTHQKYYQRLKERKLNRTILSTCSVFLSLLAELALKANQLRRCFHRYHPTSSAFGQELHTYILKAIINPKAAVRFVEEGPRLWVAIIVLSIGSSLFSSAPHCDLLGPHRTTKLWCQLEVKYLINLKVKHYKSRSETHITVVVLWL